ncbi:MAG: trimeric autotransporter adhesin, partial [Candidatus Hydrogenedentes bacterium]|nr:trimeric autotransporter adhesin [Candidatus Hydrogenedentota bacterium]
VQLTATPAADYRFDGWEGDLTGNDNPASITMDGDKTVTARFVYAPPEYVLDVQISPAGGGTVALDPPGGSYTENTIVQLTATPAENYRFDGWEGDLTCADNPACIAMNDDKTATARFVYDAQQYALNARSIPDEAAPVDSSRYRSLRDYYPVAIGNQWTVLEPGTGRALVTVTTTDIFSVNQYTVWEHLWEYTDAPGASQVWYEVAVGDWVYRTDVLDDLNTLPAISGNMTPWLPEHNFMGETVDVPGQPGKTLTVFDGTLSDFVTGAAGSPHGDVPDVLAFVDQEGGLQAILGGCLGPLIDKGPPIAFVEVESVSGCE